MTLLPQPPSCLPSLGKGSVPSPTGGGLGSGKKCQLPYKHQKSTITKLFNNYNHSQPCPIFPRQEMLPHSTIQALLSDGPMPFPFDLLLLIDCGIVT